MSPKKRSASPLSWSFIYAVGSLAVKLAILIVLSQHLTPSEFGIYGILMAVAILITVIGQLGIPTSIITSSKTPPEELLGTGLIIGAFSSSVLFAVSTYAYACSPSSTLTLNSGHGLLLYLIILTQVGINILESAQRRTLNFKLLATSELIATSIGSGLITLSLAFISPSALALLAGQLSYCLIKYGILAISSDGRIFRTFKLTYASELTKNSSSIVIAEVANMALIQLQRPIIGNRIGVEAAGLWARVYQIILLQLSALVQPLDNLFLPTLTKLNGEIERQQASVLSMIQLVGLVTLPCATATILTAPYLVPLLFGDAWRPLIEPLQIGSTILFFRGFERILISSSRALGTMTKRAQIQIVQLFIVLTLIYFAAPFGILWASWAYLGALTIGFSISLHTLRATVNISTSKVVEALIPGLVLATPPLLTSLMFKNLELLNIDSLSMLAAMLSFIGAVAILMRWRHKLLLPTSIAAIQRISHKISSK